MRVAICDDEPVFIEQLYKLLEPQKQISECNSYDSLESFWAAVSKGDSYDIVFMDIEWNERLNGIDYAAKLCKQCPDTQIIYVTAYNDRFSQSIFLKDVNLCGYLVKPVREENLMLLLQKASRIIALNQGKRISLQCKGLTQTIELSRVVYIESSAHQVLFHTENEVYTIYEKLDSIMRRLPDYFLRIHKSFVINMDYVEKLDSQSVQLHGAIQLPVSKKQSRDCRDQYLRYVRSQLL